jgi:hypothetical protein
VLEAIAALTGELRVAEKVGGEWIVRVVMLSSSCFRLPDSRLARRPLEFYDKIPTKHDPPPPG